jgi:hypothetical protein
MAYQIKRDTNGQLLARRVDGPPIIQAESSFRMHGRFRVNIKHFINPETSECWWALSRLRTSLLRDSPRDGPHFICRDKNYGRPMLVQYDQPLILWCANWLIAETPVKLLDLQGGVLSGSNIYGESFGQKNNCLCLGGSLNPLSLQPVEMLLFNQANRDLSWQGGSLAGEWQNPPNDQHFLIHSWPSYLQTQPIPHAVIDAIAAWSPT